MHFSLFFSFYSLNRPTYSSLVNSSNNPSNKWSRMMPGEAMLFLFAVIMAALLLFMMVFFVIMFSDLECDYINPIDLCNKLNQFVLPEMGAHAFLFFMFLINGSWVSMLLNLPLLAHNVNKVIKGRHMYDATEIFRTISKHKKECFIKLGFYLICFFFYLYRMIVALIAADA